jgi:hypothetical protein
MPRATKRVYKKHTERMGQNICPSVPKILPEQLHPASNNEDILLRKVLPPGQYRSFTMSICSLDSRTFILLLFCFCCREIKNPF